VAIIAMSGTAQANMLDISQKLGTVGFVQKPFAFDELFTAVTKALGGESPHR
jgi:FixJ family two-component response regulator